jgi:hypothetical protein
MISTPTVAGYAPHAARSPRESRNGYSAPEPDLAASTYAEKTASRSVVVTVGAMVPSPTCVPPAVSTAASEGPALLGRERSLFYVACSRARDELVVTWAGAPSPFLPATHATGSRSVAPT